MTSNNLSGNANLFLRLPEILASVATFFLLFPYSFEITNIYIVARIYFYRSRLSATGECTPKSRLALSLPALMSVGVYAVLRFDGGILAEALYAAVCNASIFFSVEHYKGALNYYTHQAAYFANIFAAMACPYFFIILFMPDYLSLFREKGDRRKIPNLKETAFITATVFILCALVIKAYHDNAHYVDTSSIHPIVDTTFGFIRGSDVHSIINVIFWSTIITTMPFLQYAALISIFSRIPAITRGK